MKRSLFIVSLALAIGVARSPAAAEQRVDLLPEDAPFRMHVNDAPRFVAAATNSPLGHMWRDAKVQDFLGKPDLMKLLVKSLADGADERAGHLVMEEVKMLKGEIAVAFWPDSDDEEEAEAKSFHLVARMDRQDFLRSLDLDREIAAATGKKMTLVRHDFQGEVLVQTVTEDEAGDTSDSWQAHAADTLVMSADRAWVERSIVRLQATPPKVLEVTEPGIGLRVNVRALIDAADAKQAAQRAEMQEMLDREMPATPTLRAALEALGMGEMGELRVTLALREAEWEFAARLGIGRERKGLWKLFGLRPVDTQMRIAYDADDLVAVGRAQYDLLALWRELPAIFQAMGQDPAAMQAAVQQGLKGLDLEQDILATLGTDYANVGRFADGELRQAVLWSLRDPNRAEATFARLLADDGPLSPAGNPNVKVDDFRGRKVLSFEVPGGNTIAVAVAGDRLLWGDGDMVRACIRSHDGASGQTPFLASPMAARLMQRVPREAFALSLLDTQKLLQQSLGAVDSGKLNAWQQMMGARQRMQADAGDADGLEAGIQWDHLPAMEDVVRYLGPMVSYGTDDGAGLNLHWVGLYPPRP